MTKKPTTKLEKGKHYSPFEDFKMESGWIAYYKDKKYLCEFEDCLTNEKQKVRHSHGEDTVGLFYEYEPFGYKLLKEEYLGAVNLICGLDSEDDFILDKIVESSSEYYRELKRAGVLDLWFEIAPEIEDKLTLSSGIELTKEDINKIKEALKL